MLRYYASAFSDCYCKKSGEAFFRTVSTKFEENGAPPMTIMEDSLPNIKSFFNGICITGSVRSMVVRFMISIVCRHGRNSCMNAASIVRGQGRHRAQPSRFLGRVKWRAVDLLGQLCRKLLADQSWSGECLLIVDSVLVGHQGNTM